MSVQLHALLFKVDEFAKLTNANPWTIRRAIDRGDIRAVRIGKLVRIPRSELERLLSSDSRQGA